MATLDPRLLRIGIEINGQLKLYENLDITASGTKFANANQNECEVKISNLDKATRDFLLTETSPFNKNKKRKLITVEAGRISTGYALVFVGDITSAVGSQPPDIALTIKAQTGQFSKGSIIATNQPGMVPLRNIAARVAQDLELNLDFQAKPKQISNYSYTGSKTKQVEQLAALGRVNAYIDDQVLVVKEYNAPLAKRTRILNQDTGLIGIPEFTEFGVKVKMLFDNQTVLGGGLDLKSVNLPSADGLYTVSKLTFELASRDTPFYYIAEATRVGAS